MGSPSVLKLTSLEAKKRFTRLLLNDIKALEIMLNKGLIESGITRIGAEQELCLIDKEYSPSTNNLALLKAVNDAHFVPEIAKFNIEANLDPFEFKGDCFERMEKQLRKLLEKANKVADKTETRILMTGILPTLRKKHLEFEYMTPNPRYEALNESMKGQRGSDFELHIMGIDELITNHTNILFEACNTSFQVHLQIEPDEFTDKYNWAQMIAGPVMAVTANSPLLLGKRLWKETRIALFQQSVDTRSSTNIKREQEPRVTFGKDWLRGTVVDLYKDNVSRFNFLFATEMEEDSIAMLKEGKIPQLEALKMHNSTVYKWNRACYGVGGGKAHLRIENRYIPSGPTVKDEMANAAFWLGLMHGMPEDYKNLYDKAAFEDCRYNFYLACRNGLDSQFRWFGKTQSSHRLIRKVLLPIARAGLQKAKIKEETIKDLLGVIEKRISLNKNGSTWMIDNFTTLLKRSTANEASRSITKAIYENQMGSQPVHKWKNIKEEALETYKKFNKVSDIMETDVLIVREDDLVDLVINMMDWKAVKSIPVENAKNELVGLIGIQDLLKYLSMDPSQRPDTVSELMHKNFIAVSADTSTVEAVNIMAKERCSSLLVVHDKHIEGIVNESDIVQVAQMTKAFER
ncbi:CBS domain-containing protein [bacterium]|nr:CBS domain-containing protein [bacterium]